MKKKICVLFFTLIFLSCHNVIKNEVSVSSDEILYDALNPSFFKEKYKNRIVTITGNVIDIGVPKDNPTKKNTTYITIAEDDKTAVIVYFDFFVDEYVEEKQSVTVKCVFDKFERPNYFNNENFIIFSKGEIIE